jgi:hypothetical protein
LHLLLPLISDAQKGTFAALARPNVENACMPQATDVATVAHWAQPLNASLSSHAPIGTWQLCFPAALLTAACCDALQLSFSLLSPSVASASCLSTAASESLEMACSLAPLAFASKCDHFPFVAPVSGLRIMHSTLLCGVLLNVYRAACTPIFPRALCASRLPREQWYEHGVRGGFQAVDVAAHRKPAFATTALQ